RTTHADIPIVIPTGGWLLGSECEWDPAVACHPRPWRDRGSGRHDSDDGVRFVAELHRAADHVWVSAEFGSPEPVAQDDHVLAAWRVFLLPNDASERRSGSDDLEKARADSCRTYCSRGARAGERELPEATALVQRHPLERLCIPLPVVELAGGELEESTARRPGEDPHQAFRLLERQRTQQDRVH